MKKLNTYLMGMMSVAVCLFSVACSSDDGNETAPKENGKVVTVEAVFANDGMTRAAISGASNEVSASVRSMTFEEDDVLRLEQKESPYNTIDFSASTSGGGTKIHFYGSLPEGKTFSDYTAYLISKDSKWKKEGTIPTMGESLIGTIQTSLDAAFKSEAIISGDYDDKTFNKYVLSLQNAFVVKTTTGSATFYYGSETPDQTSGSLGQGQAVAVKAGIKLKTTSGAGTSAAAKTIYAF